MATMLKEEKYMLQIAYEEHVLQVQELVWGSESWPEKFRVQLPTSNGKKTTTIYGTTSREVVEVAAEYLSSCATTRPFPPGTENRVSSMNALGYRFEH